MRPKILVVDDDPFSRKLFEDLLRPKDIDLTTVATAADARRAFRLGDFNLVILDQRLPDGSGLDIFVEMRTERPRQLALLVTGYADVRDAVRAVRDGFFDYLTKPFESLEALEAVIGKALEMDRAYREIADLKETLTSSAGDPVVIGQSSGMETLFSLVRRIAPLDTTVLIEGESGTGKEVIAKLLHSLSGRVTGPLKELNCGAVPESLLEAGLFGFEKGAFTGAVKATPGYFEEANGGTIFLDEIADMSPKLQASLLRVLQEGRFTRLGSTMQRASDFRLICATNKPLESEMESGRFRSDLFYRINVVVLRVPPLRQRKVDILPLAIFFVDHFSRKFGKQVGPLAPDTVAALESAYWGGNVRELKHTIERAVVINSGGPITTAELGIALGPSTSLTMSGIPLPYREARQRFEHDYFSQLLQFTEGNVSESARLSGVARQNIYTHLTRAGIVLKS